MGYTNHSAQGVFAGEPKSAFKFWRTGIRINNPYKAPIYEIDFALSIFNYILGTNITMDNTSCMGLLQTVQKICDLVDCEGSCECPQQFVEE